MVKVEKRSHGKFMTQNLCTPQNECKMRIKTWDLCAEGKGEIKLKKICALFGEDNLFRKFKVLLSFYCNDPEKQREQLKLIVNKLH